MGFTMLGMLQNVTVPANPDGLTMQEALVQGREAELCVKNTDAQPVGQRLPVLFACHREDFEIPGNQDVHGGFFDATGKLEFGLGGGTGFSVINKTGAALHNVTAVLMALGPD